MKLFYFENDSKNGAFHFAAEEYIMRKSKDWAVLVWQTGKCVMLGKNQLCSAEINGDFAAEKGIHVTRRSSGGGTIFTDAGTFLFTLIMPAPTKNLTDETPLLQAKKIASRPVVNTLRRLGADARLLGRNDILIGDKKVSGIAQYSSGGWICTHGSLLFDADLDLLEQVLTPDSEKLSRKAVRSVKSRVTNIKKHVDCDITAFAHALRDGFFDYFNSKEGSEESGFAGEVIPYSFTAAEFAEIEIIMRDKYACPSWVVGESFLVDMPIVNLDSVREYAPAKNGSAGENTAPAESGTLPENCEYMYSAGTITTTPKPDGVGKQVAEIIPDSSCFHTKARFAAGGIDLFVDVFEGIIKRIYIRGDFLATEDITMLESLLTDIPLEKAAMDKQLSMIDITPYLGGITKEDFLSLVF